MGGEFEGLVRGFGNESVVLNEGAGDYSLRPVDSELDECKRDPLVALLDDAGLAENNFLRYEVMLFCFCGFVCFELAGIMFWLGLGRFGCSLAASDPAGHRIGEIPADQTLQRPR